MGLKLPQPDVSLSHNAVPDIRMYESMLSAVCVCVCVVCVCVCVCVLCVLCVCCVCVVCGVCACVHCSNLQRHFLKVPDER